MTTMKKIYLAGILTFAVLQVVAQITKTDTVPGQSAKFDFQQMTHGHAVTQLGIESSQIDKPSSTTDFAASLMNAINNFTALPTSYSVEFNPYRSLVPGSREKYSPLYNLSTCTRNFRVNNSLATGSLISLGVVTEKFGA